MRKPAFFALLLAVALPSIGFAGGPAMLHSTDPLSEPPPVLDRPLVLERSAVQPREKVVSRLAEDAQQAAPSDDLPVIVTLFSPTAPSESKLSPVASEEEMVKRIAFLEHDFVAAARKIGAFEPERGLSHFPIVIGTVPAGRLMDLAGMPEVRAVEGISELTATRTEGGALIHSPQLRNQFGGKGAGVGVAVVDTGVDATHPEFAGRVVAQGDFTGTTGSGVIDDNGHGTAVAGIVGGASGGMAPAASLWAIKVLDKNGTGTIDKALLALNSLFANRNQFGGLDIVNLSVGGALRFNTFAACDAALPAETMIVNALASAGVTIFAASGNDAVKTGISSPGCLTNTISVGAVYDGNLGSASFDNCSDSTTKADKIACYSNSGALLDTLAPSHCARTPKPGGGYFPCFGGTSASTPYAAGVAAQILSLRPNTKPGQMLDALGTTGKAITDKNGITRRRIDAVEAYQHLTGGGGGGGGGGNTSPCVPGEFTLCAVGGRFEITSTAPRSLFPGLAGRVSPVIDADLGGAFHYFQAESNFHTVVKIGLRPSGFYAVSAVALDPLEWTVRVRDTMTGQVKSYTNPEGGLGVPTDVQAFEANP